MAALTRDQIESYRRDGFLFPFPALGEDERLACLAGLERYERWLGKPVPQADLRWRTQPHALLPWYANLVCHPRILDVVESLIGPDIALWSSHFIAKPAGTGKRVPWHEDSAYWGRVLDPMEVVTVWLAIDPSTSENGCMKVIPRTHNHGYSQYEPVKDAGGSVFATEIRKELFDESKAVDCILEPNHCSIHHAKAIHGSSANTSAMRRCGYTMRYVPATSKFRPADGLSAFQIYLARGKDRADNKYGDPTKPNEQWITADREVRRKAKLLAG